MSAPLRDRIAWRLANAALHIGTRQYRDRLADLLEKGLAHRAPAPQVAAEWRPEPGQPGENGGDRAGLAGREPGEVPSVAPVSVLDTEGGRAFLAQLLRNDPTPLTVEVVRRVLADTGSRYTLDDVAAEFGVDLTEPENGGRQQ